MAALADHVMSSPADCPQVSVVEIRTMQFLLFDVLPTTVEGAPSAARLRRLLLALVVHRTSRLYEGASSPVVHVTARNGT